MGLLLALTLAASVAFTAPERPPNVVVVLADDLGWGELGCYGQTKIPTPNIDRIATEGMRFTQAYSGSAVCAPSRCVLLTGLHTGHAIVRNNWERGGWGPDQAEGQFPLPAQTPTLARALHERGFVNGCVGKWGLGGPETSGAPENQAFDFFLGYLCQRVAHNYYPTHLWRNAAKLPLEGNEWFSAHQKIDAPLETEAEYWRRFQGRTYASEVMIDGALEFVREHSEQPFFLFYASPIPHVALQIPPAELEAFPRAWDAEPYLGDKGYVPHPRPRAAYAAMIARLDSEVGRIVALLDKLELTRDTIVVITSDNGTTYAGGVDPKFFNSTAHLRGLKGSLYEGGLRVPFIVRWPGRIDAGGVSDHVLAFQDLWPTLDTLLDLPGDPPADGISFAPTLLGDGEQRAHTRLYWELGDRQALRSADLKAVRTALDTDSPRIELFDLDADPSEAQNLDSRRPDDVTKFIAAFADARRPSLDFPLRGVDPSSAADNE